jgi:hypothetical protein
MKTAGQHFLVFDLWLNQMATKDSANMATALLKVPRADAYR